MLDIIKISDPNQAVLLKPAQPVVVFDGVLHALLDAMHATMRANEETIPLAFLCHFFGCPKIRVAQLYHAALKRQARRSFNPSTGLIVILAQVYRGCGGQDGCFNPSTGLKVILYHGSLTRQA